MQVFLFLDRTLEFSVADAGAKAHFSLHLGAAPNHGARGITRNAVTAAERGVGAEDAQKILQSIKVSARVNDRTGYDFAQAARRDCERFAACEDFA